MEEQNNKNEQLTNAQLELQADAAGPSEVKRISYASLIARRFFRQRSAVVGLTILGILVLLAIFGPLICKYNYTDPDFTAINVAPNARHWFGTDGGGFDLFACAVLIGNGVVGRVQPRSVAIGNTCNHRRLGPAVRTHLRLLERNGVIADVSASDGEV